MKLNKIALAALLLGLAPIAGAAPTYFFNDPAASRAAFNASAGTVTAESFESAFAPAASVSFPVGGPQAFMVTTTSGNLARNDFTRLVTDGSFALAFDEDVSLTITFAFATPITAFGIDVNDMNFGTMSFSDDLGDSLTAVLVGDNGGAAGGPDFQNLQFFGVVNTQPFGTVQLTFTNTSGLTGTLALDRLEYSSAVPEPSVTLLVSLALGGLVVSRRRR